MAEILYYNSHLSNNYDKFVEICKNNNVSIIEVGEEELDYYVGYLINLDGFSDQKKESLDSQTSLDFDFILLSNFTNEEMFRVIDQLRENQASVSHKAAVTENNIKWTLRELLIENDREATTMGLIHKINSQLEKSSELKAKYGEDEKIKNLIEEIKTFFSDQSIFSIDKAKDYYLKLMDENLRVEKENN